MTDNPKEYPYPIGPLAESFPPLSRRGMPPWWSGLPSIVSVCRHRLEGGDHFRSGTPEGLQRGWHGAPVRTIGRRCGPDRGSCRSGYSFPGNGQQRAGAGSLDGLRVVHPGRPRDEDQNSANLQNKTRAAMAERFGVSVRLINYFAQVLSENSKRAGVAAGGEGVEDQGDGRRPGDIPPGRGAGEGGGAGDEQGSPDRQPGGGAG